MKPSEASADLDAAVLATVDAHALNVATQLPMESMKHRSQMPLASCDQPGRKPNSPLAGYATIEDAIRSTAHLSQPAAARELGVSVKRVRRVRVKLGLAGAAVERRVRTLGYASVEDAIRATAQLPEAVAAEQLTMTPSYVQGMRVKLGLGGAVEQRVRAAGYASVEDAIRATAQLPEAVAAEQLTMTPSRVHNIRAMLGLAGPAIERRVRALGYRSVRDAIRATAHLSPKEAAEALTISSEYVRARRDDWGLTISEDVAVRAYGFADVQDAIRVTSPLSAIEAAKRLPLSASRVRTLRVELGLTGSVGERRVRALGFADVEDAMRRTANLHYMDAAERLGYAPSTVIQYRRRFGISKGRKR